MGGHGVCVVSGVRGYGGYANTIFLEKRWESKGFHKAGGGIVIGGKYRYWGGSYPFYSRDGGGVGLDSWSCFFAIPFLLFILCAPKLVLSPVIYCAFTAFQLSSVGMRCLDRPLESTHPGPQVYSVEISTHPILCRTSNPLPQSLSILHTPTPAALPIILELHHIPTSPLPPLSSIRKPQHETYLEQHFVP